MDRYPGSKWRPALIIGLAMFSIGATGVILVLSHYERGQFRLTESTRKRPRPVVRPPATPAAVPPAPDAGPAGMFPPPAPAPRPPR
jgi:hypothetical protein